MSQASVLDLALPDLIEQLLKLDVKAKQQIADALWESVADEEPFVLTDELKAKLDQRLAKLDADPNASEPWDVVRARLLAEE